METDLDDHLVAGAFDHDRLGVDDRLVLHEPADKFLDTFRVHDLKRLGPVLAFVEECERKRGIDIGEVVQAGDDAFRLELGRFEENFGIRQERDQRAGLLLGFVFRGDMQGLFRHAALE